MSEERRQHFRVHSRLRCWCEGENVTVYARIGNLSEGGLFLRTSTPLREGSRAVVRLRDGEAEEVSAKVTLVWTSEGGGGAPPGMGLRFDTLDDVSRERIRNIIAAEQQRAPQLRVG